MHATLSRSVLALLAGGMVMAAGSASAATWRQDRVELDATRGTPSILEGQWQLRMDSRDPVAVAEAFLAKMGARIGIQDPASELRVLTVVADAQGEQHVKFAHFSKGLPVFGSELIVHLKGDTVTWLNGAFLPSQNVPLRVVVDSHDAASLAVDHLSDLLNQGLADVEVADRDKALRLDDSPRLVWFNLGLLEGTRTSTELAWEFSINGYQYFVSARTGHVIDAFDNVHTGLNREVYTAKNTTNLPGTLVCSDAKSGCSSNDADANGAYDQFGQTYNYFSSVHGRDSYDAKGAKLIGTVHYSQNFVNAYWDGKQMVFGDNMVANDVTAHELSHAVTEYTAGLVYKSQSGALNESYSDVYGAMVDRGDWLMGEDLSIGAIRDLSDPNAYSQPKDMTEYKNYKFYDNGGVHINSGIPNFAAFLLSDGGTNQGVKVTGQGRQVTEKIWYKVETTALTSSAQFKDFANACVKTCGTLYGGTTSKQCTETTNAFKATKVL